MAKQRMNPETGEVFDDDDAIPVEPEVPGAIVEPALPDGFKGFGGRRRWWNPRGAASKRTGAVAGITQNPIQGRYLAMRVVPAQQRGRKDETVMDLVTDEYGLVTLRVNGTLNAQVAEAQPAVNDVVYVRWLHKLPPDPDRNLPMGLHVYQFAVQRAR